MLTDFISQFRGIKQSFSFVKEDILNLWGHIQNTNKRVDQEVADLKHEITKLRFELAASQAHQVAPHQAHETVKETIKLVPIEKKHELIANTVSGKVHDEQCVFARKILPEHKVTVDSLIHATSRGYDTCVCLEA